MDLAFCYPVPEAYDYAAKLGCSKGYLDICWPRIQPEKGEFDFSYYDPVMEAATAADLELIGMVSSRRNTFPDGHWIWDNHRGMLPDRDNWSGFLKEVVKRYRDTIRYWEVWSEPNCLACNPMCYYDPEVYLEVLKTASAAIREADPSAKILLGGIWLNQVTRKYLDKLLGELGGADYFDIFSWHFFLMTPFNNCKPFSFWKESLTRWVEYFRSMIPAHYPLWITEFGVPTRRADSPLLNTSTKGRIVGVTEEEQADFFGEFWETAESEWDTGTLVWICLKDQFNEARPYDFNDNLGMLRVDWSEKPVQRLAAEFQARSAGRQAAVKGGG